jgi:choline dehydrogenase-like flavoprotein
VAERVVRWAVVGGGAAGCVVAARLSERQDHDVLLLEAGPDHGPEHAPADVGPLVTDPSRLRVEHVVRRWGGVPEPYWQGLGLGGSSLVNGSIVVPDPDSAGQPTELLRRRSRGPTARSAPRCSRPTRPRLGSGSPGRQRLRVTVADAYLRPVLDRTNLDRPDRRRGSRRAIRRAGGRSVSSSPPARSCQADRVVLCAGAIRTPTILFRSGVDTPGVGEGLQDHPAFTITLALRPEAIDPTVPTIAVAAVHDDHQVVALNHLPGSPDLGALTVGLLRVRSTGRAHPARSRRGAARRARPAQDPADAEPRSAGRWATHSTGWATGVGHRRRCRLRRRRGTPTAAIAGSPERIAAWVPEHLGGHHHVAGTCADGVVTDGGVVRGYDDLYVCDASVFRGVPARNPYLSVIALAERTVRAWTGASSWHDEAEPGS